VFEATLSSFLAVKLDIMDLANMPFEGQHRIPNLTHVKPAAGIKDDPAGPLFRSADWHTGSLNPVPLHHVNAWQMMQRRARAAGLETRVCNHTFRATGITAYLSNGGSVEKAQQMAIHSDRRTTKLYHRRRDDHDLNAISQEIRGLRQTVPASARARASLPPLGRRRRIAFV